MPIAGSESVVGADRGVAVTLALSDGGLLSMPSFVGAARDGISESLRQRTGKKVGSRAWRSLNRQMAKAHRKAAQRSDNWACHTARQLVDQYGVIVLEDLKLKNMVRSARGTTECPGTNVAAKQALNRKLADTALGKVRYRLCVKAEEAGRRAWVVNPANTSRTCASCGHCAAWNRRSRPISLRRMPPRSPCRPERSREHRRTRSSLRNGVAGRRLGPAGSASTGPSSPPAGARGGGHPGRLTRQEPGAGPAPGHPPIGCRTGKKCPQALNGE